MKILRLILGDQLNIHHSWFNEVNQDHIYVMMEVRQETDYVRHHIQKIMGIFAAMRSFSDTLKAMGHHVVYLKISDPNNLQHIPSNLKFLANQHHCEKIEYLEPDEYRLDVQFKNLSDEIGIPSTSCSTEHFMTPRDGFKKVFGERKNFLMETFYRRMRKDFNILMDHGKPIGGVWNLDMENRKKLPPDIDIPKPLEFNADLTSLYQEILTAGIETIGKVDASTFLWPVNRDQSIMLLNYFCQYGLKNFGTYQDALTENSWSVFHARISFSLNIKLISPLETVQTVIEYWQKHSENISLNQVEGFVRQIIGWREYMRCLYWNEMPEFADKNFFGHERKLPSWFWTGQTKMKCLHHTISQSMEFAYAHHIQRLMITGNFMLLTGIHPDEADLWYLGIYIDAFEWVEITNTRGMSQYADGGLTATKPYISSASYIDKMGSYCKSCTYNKASKTGHLSCPFNSLYWNFLDINREKLNSNPRMGMMYNVWDKMDNSTQIEIRRQAEYYLDNIELL
jgi:deoxyribodipyrimidine photolyase-related protein